MNFATVYLEENKIEIFHSILGRETIKVNGEIVSSKYSYIGGEHLFSITENGRVSNCKLRMGYGFNGLVFDLYKDQKTIIESAKSDYFNIYKVQLISGILLGIIIGLKLF